MLYICFDFNSQDKFEDGLITKFIESVCQLYYHLKFPISISLTIFQLKPTGYGKFIGYSISRKVDGVGI